MLAPGQKTPDTNANSSQRRTRDSVGVHDASPALRWRGAAEHRRQGDHDGDTGTSLVDTVQGAGEAPWEHTVAVMAPAGLPAAGNSTSDPYPAPWYI